MKVAQENSGKTRKTSLLAVVILIMVLIVAFFAFSFYTKTFIFAEESKPITTEFTYPMEEITINLKDGEHYLKTKIALGYGLEKDQEVIKSKEIQLRDGIIRILRSKSMEEIMPVEKTDALKKEMKRQLNQCFDKEIITDVYITEFLIQ